MNLNYYEGKNVRLTDINSKVYEGYAADYIFAEDNELMEVEVIILDYPIRKNDGYKYKNPVEFTRPEIRFIEVVDS